MLWRVRATLADRPGALATLAASCGERGVNILGLEVFPQPGEVTDELLLAAPGDWDAEEVRALVVGSGGDRVAVSRCSERDLVDPPTKYLRAALRLLDRPDDLREALADLLDVDAWARPGAGEDVLTVEVTGTAEHLRRGVAFTEIERARAAVLAEFPRLALSRTPVRPSGHGWSVRRGRLPDGPAVRRMHERCSTETLFRRYHSPMPRVPQRFETQLLEPAGGASFVAVVENEVVGMVVLAPHGEEVTEVGILVEDGWQRQGVGSDLLRTAAVHAAGQQHVAMLAIVQSDNRAPLATVRRCGLTCRVQSVDGVVRLTIPLTRLLTGGARSGSGGESARQVEEARARSLT